MFKLTRLNIYVVFMVLFLVCTYMIKMTSGNIMEAYQEYKEIQYVHDHHHSNNFNNTSKVENFVCDFKHKNKCLAREHHDDDFADTAPFQKANKTTEHFACNCGSGGVASFANLGENFTNSCEALIC